MTSVTITVPDEILAALHRSPRALADAIRSAAAVDWYRRGLFSQGRAAEVAGLTRADFVDARTARRIEVVQLGVDDLACEIGDA